MPLWNAFLSLGQWRTGGGMSASPLSLADVRAYQACYGVRFTPWELDMMKRLDVVSLRTASPEPTSTSTTQGTPTANITPWPERTQECR